MIPPIAILKIAYMLEQLHTFSNPNGFIPHGHCYLWNAPLVWLHIVSNSLIAISYLSIPITLVYFTAKREDVPFNWVFFMFGAFILACGAGHIMDIWTLWHPNYWTEGIIRALTAIISVATAIELVPLVPKALALPKPAELEAANQRLEATLAQLQETQIQLIQTEKMSSLGQLVAGIAHEINNPINFIHGNLKHAREYVSELVELISLYAKSYPEPTTEIQQAIEDSEVEFIVEDLPNLVASMQVGSQRIRQLVLSLRNFSRLGEVEMKVVDLHEGLDSTLLILQNHLQQKHTQSAIKVIKEYDENLSSVECYAGQLNQVFMNILANAIDALKSGGIGAQIDSELTHTPCIWIRTKMCDADWVMVEIADNGTGLSEEVKQKIFNPFFTTKDVGKGTGLGLSISYQIVVDTHGGALDCISAPGKGAKFCVKIPKRRARVASSPAAVQQLKPA